MTMLPILIYEIGAVGFWFMNLGLLSFKTIHRVAWAQDLAWIMPLFSVALFVYYTYKELIEEEEARVDVPRYERPAHERYTRSVDPDGDRP